MQARLGLGERTSVHLAARCKEDEEVDQLLIGVGDRRSGHERPVDQLELHVVVTDDDDVLDPVVVDQWLEAAEPEQRVEHGLGGRLLLRGAPRPMAGVDGLGHRRFDQVQNDRPAEFLLRLLVQTGAIRLHGLAQLLRRLSTQRRDQGPIDVGRGCRRRRHRGVEIAGCWCDAVGQSD